MFRYALYARKSDDDPKVTAKSIGEQIRECRQLSVRDGLLITREWEESKSARLPHQRPNYAELIKAIRRGEIDGILCWHVNRLARNMEEGGALVQLLINGQLKEIRTPHATYRNGENILPVVIEAASAAQYSIDLQQVVKRAMRANFQSGGCNYRVPPGYRNARDPLNLRRSIVERDGRRFDQIRTLWELMLSGTYTVKQAVGILNAEHHYKSRATEGRAPGPLTLGNAYHLLRNPFYAGFVRGFGELSRGRHEPMVSTEEFERVQSLLRQRVPKSHRNREHLFTGLMRCGYCGQAITAESKILRNGTVWENYRCTESRGKCTKAGISASRLEAGIEHALRSLQIGDKALHIADHSISGRLEHEWESMKQLAEGHAHAEAEARAKLKRVEDMWISGMLTDPVRFRELQRQVTETIEKLQLRSEQTRREIEIVRENLKRATDYMRLSADAFRSGGREVKRALAASLGGYRFFGREKRIEILLHPHVSALRQAASPIDEIEPSISGSGRHKFEVPYDSFRFGTPFSPPVAPNRNPNYNRGCVVETVMEPMGRERIREVLAEESFPKIPLSPPHDLSGILQGWKDGG